MTGTRESVAFAGYRTTAATMPAEQITRLAVVFLEDGPRANRAYLRSEPQTNPDAHSPWWEDYRPAEPPRAKHVPYDKHPEQIAAVWVHHPGADSRRNRR